MLCSGLEGTQMSSKMTDSSISLATKPTCFSNTAHLFRQSSRDAKCNSSLYKRMLFIVRERHLLDFLADGGQNKQVAARGNVPRQLEKYQSCSSIRSRSIKKVNDTTGEGVNRQFVHLSLVFARADEGEPRGFHMPSIDILALT